MAFTLSGTTITQTGTDTNLSGLSGIAGVTHYNETTNDIYVLDGVSLIINGVLSIAPETERLVFLESCPLNCFNQNGTLTVGSSSVINGEVVNSSGEWLDIIKSGSNAFSTGNAGFVMGSSSVTNFYGGSIKSNSSIVFDGTVTTTAQDITLLAGSVGGMKRLLPNGGSLSNITCRNNGFKIIGTLDESPINLKLINASALGVMVDSRFGAQNFLELEGYDYVANGGFILVADDSSIVSKNTPKGSSIPVSHNTTNGGNNQYVKFTRDIEIGVFDLSGNPVEGAKVSIKDFDNGNRGNVGGLNAEDFTGDRTINTLTNSSGLMTGSVLLAVKYRIDSNQIDYRSKSNSDVDDFDLKMVSYNGIISQTTQVLKGDESFTFNFSEVSDSSVSELVKATVDAYTTLDNAQQFYDRAKAYLVDNYLGENATIVTRTGDTIDAGSNNVELRSGGSNTFEFDGTTVSVRVGTLFTGNITTTGVVTFSGSASINGNIVDVNGDSDATINLPSEADIFTIHSNRLDADSGASPLFSGSDVNNNMRYLVSVYGGQSLYVRATSSTDSDLELIATELVPSVAGSHIFNNLAFNEDAQLNAIKEVTDKLGSMVELDGTGNWIFKTTALQKVWSWAKRTLNKSLFE